MKFGTIAALLSLPSAVNAQSAATCLTDTEARALFSYMMPEALEGVTHSCRSALPATAYLPTHGQADIARYRAAATGSWPGARAAFFKIATKDGDDGARVIATMSDAALKPFVDEALSGFVAKDVKAADCPKIDRFVAALAPLTPANVAELITALVGLVGGKEKADLNLC
jgi:hypothetical protein